MSNPNNEIVDATRSTADDTPEQLGLERLDSEHRLRRISEAAYQRAESRGFAPGYELDDWLEAEREIDAAARPSGDGSLRPALGAERDGTAHPEGAAGGAPGLDELDDLHAGTGTDEQQQAEANAVAQRSAREHARRRTT